MAAVHAPQTGVSYELRLGDGVLGKRKADEALYTLKTQFKPQSAGTFRPGNLQLDAQGHQASSARNLMAAGSITQPMPVFMDSLGQGLKKKCESDHGMYMELVRLRVHMQTYPGMAHGQTLQTHICAHA